MLVCSATSDAATTQQEINKIKNKNIRMYHPWSLLTDGHLYGHSVNSIQFNSIIYSHNTVQLYSMHVSVTKYNVDPSIHQYK